VKMPIRAVRAALVWFRKTTALDGKAGIGAGAAIDPVAPIPDVRVTTVERLKSTLSGRSGQRRNRVSGQRLGFRKWRGFD